MNDVPYALNQALEGAEGAQGVMLEGRDLFVVAKCMVPTDAWLLQGVLAAGGVPAVVADAHHVQADLLIAPALGGVRVLAPEAFLAQAADIIAAYERGDYAIDEDADVGSPHDEARQRTHG